MKKPFFPFFIQGTVQLGIGLGVVILLARWASGNSFLFSPDVLVNYGLIGGIGFAIVGAIVFLLLGMIAKVIRDKFPTSKTIGDALQEKLSPTGYRFMVVFLLFLGMFSILFQVIGAGLLIQSFLSVHAFIGTALFLMLAMLIGGLGGMTRIHQLSIVTVVILFSAIIIIPVYSYIQEGVYPIYKGVRLYHPYILFLRNHEAIFFSLTIFLVALGLVLTDRPTWQHIFTIKREKLKMTFWLFGFIWATIPLALMALLMFVISGRGFQDMLALVFTIPTTVLLILFIVFCIFTILSSISNEVHAIVTLLVKNVIEHLLPLTERDRKKYTVFFTLVIGSLLLVVSGFFLSIPLQVFYVFGNIYTAFVLPMLWIIYSKRTVPTFIPFTTIISTITGYMTYPLLGALQSIWVTFFVSLILCATFFFIRRILNYKHV